MKTEAVHVAIIGKALLGDHRASDIYSLNEALDILTKKLTTLNSFTGRQKLHIEDHVIYWSIYGVLEILETKHSDKTEII